MNPDHQYIATTIEKIALGTCEVGMAEAFKLKAAIEKAKGPAAKGLAKLIRERLAAIEARDGG